MDKDVEISMNHENTMKIIKAVGRIFLTAVAIIGVAGYACEREDSKSAAAKIPCKQYTYTCNDK
jgi:hypothetical protein